MLQSRGYRTALMGKYLNEYTATYPAPRVLGDLTPPESTYVPPGWDKWDAAGNGYYQYHYLLNHDHHVINHGYKKKDYLNSVLQHYATRFVSDNAAQHRPFFLEVASFSPHTPSTPAPRDLGTYRGLTVPKGPAFNRLPINPPSWIATRQPLSLTNIASLDRAYQKRVESIQSVDRMIGALRATLAQVGQAQNTVFVFSSDNGYHMGEYTLRSGKQTAFDTDVHVPLIVAGPGIPAHTTNSDVVENIDLRPTFDQIAGAPTPANVDGHSLVPLLRGRHPLWRTVAGIEHHRGPQRLSDPDLQNNFQGIPPSYDAIRTARYTYVRYVDGDREFYNRVHATR